MPSEWDLEMESLKDYKGASFAPSKPKVEVESVVVVSEEEKALLKFVDHLNKRGLAICSYSNITNGYWPINISMTEYVQNYLEGK